MSTFVPFPIHSRVDVANLSNGRGHFNDHMALRGNYALSVYSLLGRLLDGLLNFYSYRKKPSVKILRTFPCNRGILTAVILRLNREGVWSAFEALSRRAALLDPRAVGFEAIRIFVRHKYGSKAVPYELLADIGVGSSDVPGAVQGGGGGCEGKELETGELHGGCCSKVIFLMCIEVMLSLM